MCIYDAWDYICLPRCNWLCVCLGGGCWWWWCVCESVWIWMYVHCVSYGHVTMFMSRCFHAHVLACIYIHLSMWVNGCCVCDDLGFIHPCVWLGHLCGDVFVRVFLLECLQDGNVQIRVQSPIYMYTVPSSGHQKKASPNPAKKVGCDLVSH